MGFTFHAAGLLDSFLMYFPTPSGAASLPGRIRHFGEDCLSPSTWLRIDSASSRAILFGTVAKFPEGRARAEMVLGTFAETKVPRLQGRNPASNHFPRKPFINQPSLKKDPTWVPD